MEHVGPEIVDPLDVIEALEALEAAVAEVARCDLSVLGDPESITRLQRVGAQTSAVVTGAVAAFDAAEAYALSGARTTAAWLKAECHLPGPDASRQVRRGRLCRHVPLFERAWSNGEISAACLDMVAVVR